MIRKSPREIIKKIKKKIYSTEFMEKNRVSDKDFSRKRKLPFPILVLFMINIIKQTVQKELTRFVKLLDNKTTNVSKSAFSQSRIKLKPEAFIELNDVLIEEFYTDNIIKKWKGFRLIAIDGSKLILPTSSKELNDKFGTLCNGMILPQAQISSCYDVLNEIIIDSQLEPIQINEMNQAVKLLEKLNKKDLILLDRGYAAVWVYFLLVNKKINFVNRVPKQFIKEAKEFRKSKETSKIIEITNCPQKSRYGLERYGIKKINPFKLRLVKVILDTGEIEILATTLIDENKYPLEVFKELYFQRWGVETNFDHLKSNLNVEDFTGLSEISIRQDFFVSIFINNLQSIIALDSQEEMDENRNEKNKHNYKVNKNLSLGYMKDRIVKILTSDNPGYYEELKELFKVNPIPIRNGRKNLREMHPTNRRKYYINRKRAV